jgi:hypothetical protein
MRLVRAVYEAFPADGAFIAVEALIDDARRENVLGPLPSLNMTGCEPRRRLIKATRLNQLGDLARLRG